MPLEDFMLHIYLIADNFLKTVGRFAKEGFKPKLKDSEAMTMEIVGEYLGLEKDKRIYDYFKRQWLAWFPKLEDRTTFTRQCANLWQVKEQLRLHLVNMIMPFCNLFLFDGLPIPICHIKRVRRKNPFFGQAAFSYCAAKDQKYFGFKGHLVTHVSGLILSYEMAAANIDERDILPELTRNYKGLMVADKGLMRPSLKEELGDYGLDLQTPLRNNMVDTRPKKWIQQIISVRRTIETVISQLADRFQIQSIKAKDLWHLSTKVGRKILAHTCCFFTIKSLHFDAIIA